MKRGKKLWIVCGVLAVVVAMCAFALFYRPAPYHFLRGATLVSIDVPADTMAIPRPPDETYHKYKITGTFADVVTDARKELTLKDGWGVDIQNDWVLIEHRDKGWIIIAEKGAWSSKKDQFPDQPGTVQVLVAQPTTIEDRVIAWIDRLFARPVAVPELVSNDQE